MLKPTRCSRLLGGPLAVLAAASLLFWASAGGFTRATEARTSVKEAVRGAFEGAAARRTLKKRRDPRLFMPRQTPAPTPHFLVMVDPPQAVVGAHVITTVRLTGGRGPARRAAFRVGVDPELMRYVGHLPTGRGALVVEESQTPGELVVYRSSLPEGFAEVEPMVEIEYECLAPGSGSVFLTDVRLFDGLATELSATHESTTLEIE